MYVTMNSPVRVAGSNTHPCTYFLLKFSKLAIVVIIENGKVKQIYDTEEGRKQGKECSNCKFKQSCLGVGPVPNPTAGADYFSHEGSGRVHTPPLQHSLASERGAVAPGVVPCGTADLVRAAGGNDDSGNGRGRASPGLQRYNAAVPEFHHPAFRLEERSTVDPLRTIKSKEPLDTLRKQVRF